MELLYQTLNQRKRPEDVAQMTLDIRGDYMTSEEQKIIQKATQSSLKSNFWGYSSMAQTFAKPIGAKQQMDTAIDLFKLKSEQFDPNNTQDILNFITAVSDIIKKTVGENNFLTDRKK